MSVIFEYKASDLTQYYRIQYFDENNKEIKKIFNMGKITEENFNLRV